MRVRFQAFSLTEDDPLGKTYLIDDFREFLARLRELRRDPLDEFARPTQKNRRR